MATHDPTCNAHYSNDPNPCTGPAVVTVMFNQSQGSTACEQHAIDRLATMPDAWPIALPDAPPGAAIRIFQAART